LRRSDKILGGLPYGIPPIRKLKELGVDLQTIKESTELTDEEIERL